MQEIEQGIYINNNYRGLTLGALIFDHGTILVDAPPHPDDGHAWVSILRSLGGGANRMVTVLDSHPDRTIGLRALDMPIIAHQSAGHVLNGRPAIFKGQNAASGAAWETCDGLSGIRWSRATITFSEAAILDWGADKFVVEYHPGPAPGASWVIAHEQGVVFIGDAVTVNQPPFFADANIDEWAESLDMLMTKPYRDYIVVSARGGVVEQGDIREMRRFIKEVQKRLDRYFERQAPVEEVLKTVPNLLSRFNFPREGAVLYEQRLAHGIARYYKRVYHRAPDEEEI
jgi:glyoxylase-like metal-dependent hydrolase (beta-lactamase superfamily II)